MSLVERAKDLLELAAKRTRGTFVRPGNVEADTVFIHYADGLAGPIIGERVLLRFNKHFPFADDIAYLVAAWDLAEVLACEYISQSETLQCCGKALARAVRAAVEDEATIRALMAAGLAAVEQARQEEREACLHIIADEYTRPQAYSLRNAADRIRARNP